MADDFLTPVRITRKQAKAAGLKTYFTGRVCKNGHVAPRSVGSQDCTQCRAERYTTWVQLNPDRNRETRRLYREKNREKIREWNRTSIMRNYEKVRAAARASYRANPQRQRQATLSYYERNPLRRYYSHINVIARKRGWSGPNIPFDAYVRMLEAQSGRCAYCGRETKLTLDHVTPLFHNGAHHVSNCLMCCRPCNTLKRYLPLQRFLEVLAAKRPGLWTATLADIERLLSAEWRRP